MRSDCGAPRTLDAHYERECAARRAWEQAQEFDLAVD
jgi:hypothetical protein